MAKRTREEWLAGLQPGDTISVTFPGDGYPSIGKVRSVDGSTVLGEFEGKPHPVHFELGALADESRAPLQPVSTGAGGSVGQPMNLSNIFGERAAE